MSEATTLVVLQRFLGHGVTVSLYSETTTQAVMELFSLESIQTKYQFDVHWSAKRPVPIRGSEMGFIETMNLIRIKTCVIILVHGPDGLSVCPEGLRRFWEVHQALTIYLISRESLASLTRYIPAAMWDAVQHQWKKGADGRYYAKVLLSQMVTNKDDPLCISIRK